jgi:hypothetical protein
MKHTGMENNSTEIKAGILASQILYPFVGIIEPTMLVDLFVASTSTTREIDFDLGVILM